MIRQHVIGMVGGTGAQGMGLALRFVHAGHWVVLGSRDEHRADTAAKELREQLPEHAQPRVGFGLNEDAAAAADLIVVTTPWDASPTSHEWLAPLAIGKVVISCVNPLGFDKHGAYGLPVDAGSAAEHLARQLPGALVVGAFHHVAASRLADLELSLHEEDVLVASDDPWALRVASDLARAVAGRHGIDAGPLRACRQLEPLTAVLITINKGYRTHSGVALCNVTATASSRMTGSKR